MGERPRPVVRGVPGIGEAMAKLEGITCDFQARQGRRDFSGHSEPRVLRSHSLAGRIFQPNLKLARACKARTPQTHRQQDTTFQQPLPGVYSSQSPRVLGGLGLGLVVKLAFQTLHQRNLENWDNFQCAVLGTYQIGRQAITLQDQSIGGNTTKGALEWLRHVALRGAPTSQTLAEHHAPGSTRPGLGSSHWAPTASPVPRARRGELHTAERGRGAAGCGV